MCVIFFCRVEREEVEDERVRNDGRRASIQKKKNKMENIFFIRRFKGEKRERERV